MITNPSAPSLRRFWVPALATSSGAGPGPFSSLGDMVGIFLSATNDEGFVNFWVPADFSALITAECLILPLDTQGAVNMDIYSNYGAVGEAYDTHDEQDIATTYPFTTNENVAIDVAGILSALAPLDMVGIRLILATGGGGNGRCRFLGLNFVYE